jgi:hypothetical protein
MNFHADVFSVRKDRGAISSSTLDEAENVVPSMQNSQLIVVAITLITTVRNSNHSSAREARTGSPPSYKPRARSRSTLYHEWCPEEFPNSFERSRKCRSRASLLCSAPSLEDRSKGQIPVLRVPEHYGRSTRQSQRLIRQGGHYQPRLAAHQGANHEVYAGYVRRRMCEKVNTNLTIKTAGFSESL